MAAVAAGPTECRKFTADDLGRAGRKKSEIYIFCPGRNHIGLCLSGISTATKPNECHQA